MSNVKRMDLWTVVQNYLEKNPAGVTAGALIKEAMKKTGLSRATIYEDIGRWYNQGKLYREKGRYYSEEPSKRKLDLLVEEAFRTLKEKNDTFTLEQVASEVGVPPSEIEASVYRLVKKHGWETKKTEEGDIVITTYKYEPIFFATKIPE